MATTSPRAHAGLRDAARRAEVVLAGPVWWAVHFGASYWLVPRLCAWEVRWPVHLLTVVVLALLVRGALLAVRLDRAAAGRTDPALAGRDRFLAWTGGAMTVLFTLVVVAEWLPTTQLDPCW